MGRDSDVAEAIADGRVPEGVSEAYLNESRDDASIGGIAFVFLLTLVVVICRLVSRIFMTQRFGWDDALALISLLCLTAFVGLSIKLILLGSGRHFDYIQYVMTVPVVLRTEVLDFAAHIVYTTALLICRVSGLAFYHRVCRQHNGFLIAIRVVFGVLVAGYLPQIFLIIFHCRPVTALWPYGWEPGAEEYTCLQWGLVYSVNSSVSLFCDLLIFGIPVAMLRVLNMSRSRKIQLAGILLPGVAVIGISIARLVLVILGQWEADMSWSYNPMLGVETSEIGATLIALSVPGVKPLVDRLLRGNLSTQTLGSQYRKTGEGGSHSRGTALGTLRLRPLHPGMDSQENHLGHETEIRADSPGNDSQEGIYVKVDVDVKQTSVREL